MIQPSAGTQQPQETAGLKRLGLPLLYLGLLAVSFGVHSLSLPGTLESFDGVYFARGVEQYSLPALQPQWPGYPVYIWLGKLLFLFTHDAVWSLHLLALIASSLITLLIADLTRRIKGGVWPGVFAGLLWTLVPLSLISGTEAFSDSLALLLALSGLWLTWRGHHEQKALLLGLAGLAFGLMVGVRLSYLPLLSPLLLACGLAARSVKSVRPWLWAGLAFLFPVALWFGWQLRDDGASYFAAARRHLAGHYEQWGGSIETDHQPLLRPVHALRTFLLYGLGGWWWGAPWLRMALTVIWLGLLSVGAGRLIRNRPRFALNVVLLWGGPYLVWVLLSHDVNLDRYFLPLVALACVVGGVGLPRQRWGAGGVGGLSLGLLALISLPLARQHAAVPTVEVQLAQYSETLARTQRFVLLLPKVTPLFVTYAPQTLVLDSAPGTTEAMARTYFERGYVMYATADNAALASGHWQPVMKFCRDALLKSREDSQMTLYRYLPQGAGVAPEISCAARE